MADTAVRRRVSIAPVRAATRMAHRSMSVQMREIDGMTNRHLRADARTEEENFSVRGSSRAASPRTMPQEPVARDAVSSRGTQSTRQRQWSCQPGMSAEEEELTAYLSRRDVLKSVRNLTTLPLSKPLRYPYQNGRKKKPKQPSKQEMLRRKPPAHGARTWPQQQILMCRTPLRTRRPAAEVEARAAQYRVDLAAMNAPMLFYPVCDEVAHAEARGRHAIFAAALGSIEALVRGHVCRLEHERRVVLVDAFFTAYQLRFKNAVYTIQEPSKAKPRNFRYALPPETMKVIDRGLRGIGEGGSDGESSSDASDADLASALLRGPSRVGRRSLVRAAGGSVVSRLSSQGGRLPSAAGSASASSARSVGAGSAAACGLVQLTPQGSTGGFTPQRLPATGSRVSFSQLSSLRAPSPACTATASPRVDGADDDVVSAGDVSANAQSLFPSIGRLTGVVLSAEKQPLSYGDIAPHVAADSPDAPSGFGTADTAALHAPKADREKLASRGRNLDEVD